MLIGINISAIQKIIFKHCNNIEHKQEIETLYDDNTANGLGQSSKDFVKIHK